MQPDGDDYFAQKAREEREDRLAAIREEKRQNRIREAYCAVAATEAGRIVLADWVSSNAIESPFVSFKGGAVDSFNMGYARKACDTKQYLREVLDRDTFIAIIEPIREEDDGTAE